MINKKFMAIFTLSLLLISCSSYEAAEDFPFALSDFNGKTIEVSDRILVKQGEVFDGKGNLYSWVGEGDCSQAEGMPPMFVLSSDSVLKNIWIKGAPDGVHIKGSNVLIDNMVNVDVCEDAISISKSKHVVVGENIKILNSKFYHCADKAIQLTRGNGILIKNNEFHYCAKAVRIKEDASNILFENNKVFGSKDAIKATGGSGFVKNNLIENSTNGLWAEKKAVLTDGGGNQFVNVQQNYRETEEGTISNKENELTNSSN